MTQAKYYFLPDMRQGLAAWITQSGSRRAQVTVDLHPDVCWQDGLQDTTVKPISQTVQLYGPGDILGFDSRIVVRTDPKPDVGDFEPNYFPAIEFADPDFAWRFSPASTDKDAPKLTSWIVLIVLETGVEFEEGKQTDRNLPRFIKQVSPTALPDLVYAWRWAHVQVTAEEGLSEENLKNISPDKLEQAVCRLMCPRRLKTRTRYTAFVVPTFKLGALAGRGLGFESVTDATELAWQKDNESNGQGAIELPYYYRWEFGTSELGDFEHLVRLLEPRTLSGLGIRDMDCEKPGFGTCGVARAGLQSPENHLLGLEGALQSLDTQFTPWGRDAEPPEPLQVDLAELINQPEAQRVASEIPETSFISVVPVDESCVRFDLHSTGACRVYFDYALSVTHSQRVGELGSEQEHRLYLTGLRRGMIVKYKIGVQTEDDLWREFGDFTLIVPPDLSDMKPIFVQGGLVINFVDVKTLEDQDAVQLSWRTSNPCQASVQYGLTKAYDHYVHELEATQDHQLALAGLVSGQAYHFKIILQTADGSIVESKDCTFTVPPTPTVLPPIYGRWHAARKSVNTVDQSAWIDALNLDPRHRAAAGLGAEVVRKQQEALMASAWEQLGTIESANDIFRRAQLGRANSNCVYERIGQLASDDLVLWVTNPVQKRVLVEVVDPETGPHKITAAHYLRTKSLIPAAALDPAFRRIIRPRGPIRKRQEAGLSKDLLSRLAEGELEAAGPSPKPAGTDMTRLLRPRIELTPSVLDFGTVIIREQLEKSSAIHNVGKTDLTVTSITRAEGTSQEFTFAASTTPFTIPSGESETVTVTYSPVNPGMVTGALVIESNDPDTPSGPMNLMGTGKSAPIIQVKPETLDFGTVAIRESATLQATITSIGTANLEVKSISLAQGTSQEFQFTTREFPFTIPAGGSETVMVTYSPEDQEKDIGALLIKSNDPDTPSVQLNLVGTGESAPYPKICIDPSSRQLSFGQVRREMLVPNALHIYSCGTADLEVQRIVLSAAPELRFQVSATQPPFTIQPGGRETVTVTCQPTAQAASRDYSGTLTIESNDQTETSIDIALTVEVVEDGVPHDGPVATSPGKGLTTLGHETRTSPSNPKQAFVKAVREMVFPALNPERTVSERVGKRISLRSDLAPRFEEGAQGDPLEEIMAAPTFPQAMYEPLRDMSHNLLLPGVERIPQNTIGILQANRRFLESYMCGLNHEFAGELLWRGYPTDQRGSYFRQFWDVSEYIARQEELDKLLKAWLKERKINSIDALNRAERERLIVKLGPADVGDPSVLSDQELNWQLVKLVQRSALAEKLRDVKLLTQWKGNALGHNEYRTGKELVLVIRGDLLRRYPDALIYAIKAVKHDGKLVPGLPEFADPAEQQERIFPVFGAALPPDLTFLGFPFAADAARGNEQDPGMYFVLEERVGRVRFGLDDQVPELFETWDDLSWSHFGLQEAVGNYLDSGTITNQPYMNSGKVWNDEDSSGKPQSSSATRAWITFQKPARIAVHASQMLPEPTIKDIQPRSGQQGTALVATITGQVLGGATNVRFSGSGVTAQVLPGSTSTELKLDVNIAWWAPINPRSFAVATPAGTSRSPKGIAFAVTPAPPLIITKVEALDDYTVKVVLENPAFFFAERLTNVGPYALFSPLALQKSAKDIAAHPVGTGPFVFQEWAHGSHIILSGNKAYWGKKPDFEKLIFSFVNEPMMLLSLLQSGEVDICDTLDQSVADMATGLGFNVRQLESFYRDQDVFIISRPEIGGDFVTSTGLHLEYAQSSEGSNVLRYGCLQEPTTLDPLSMQDTASLRIASQVLEGLTGYQPGKATVDRALAQNWATIDGKEWEFRLRRGVQFHDGVPFTAQSVIANFGRQSA